MLYRAVVVAVVGSGCYAELGGGYMPAVHDRATTTVAGAASTASTDTGGWTVSFNLGFYLDAPIPIPLPYVPPAIGVGLAPISANAVVPGDSAPRSSTNGYEARLDLTLPIDTGDVLSFRATGTYGWSSKASIKAQGQTDYTDADASGSEWFLGATVGGRNDQGALFQLSLGAQHQRSVSVEKATLPSYEVAATGVAMRFMIAWTPTGFLLRNGYRYQPPVEQKHNDCHPVTTTSSDGTVRTSTECF